MSPNGPHSTDRQNGKSCVLPGSNALSPNRHLLARDDYPEGTPAERLAGVDMVHLIPHMAPEILVTWVRKIVDRNPGYARWIFVITK